MSQNICLGFWLRMFALFCFVFVLFCFVFFFWVGQGVCLGSLVMMLAPVCGPGCLHWYLDKMFALVLRSGYFFGFLIEFSNIRHDSWGRMCALFFGQNVYLGFWVRIFTLVLGLGCLHI